MPAPGTTRLNTLREACEVFLARNVLREDESQTSGEARFAVSVPSGLADANACFDVFRGTSLAAVQVQQEDPCTTPASLMCMDLLGKRVCDEQHGSTGTALRDARHGDVSAVDLVRVVTSTLSGCSIWCCSCLEHDMLLLRPHLQSVSASIGESWCRAK